MKTLVIALVVAGLLPFTANADTKKKGGALDSHMAKSENVAADVGDGCGLGWQITQKRTMLATTTRGTTNGFVPPTFGMTSGTIGCEQHAFAKNELPAATYVFNNYEPLTIEMAQGSGEYLAAFARTMGCNDSVHSEFGRTMQQNFGAIMGTENTTAVEMFHNVKSAVKANPVLASGCRA